MKIFENGLTEARLRAGLSQRELAERANVGHISVCRIESGKPLTPATARKLCAALGAEFDDLFELREEVGT